MGEEIKSIYDFSSPTAAASGSAKTSNSNSFTYPNLWTFKNNTNVNPVTASITQRQSVFNPTTQDIQQGVDTVQQSDANKQAEERAAFLEDSIIKYTDQLRGEAQGDYDFAIKWLNQQHQTALGTNDTKRAEFFELVASNLEKEIGRIPYDYFQKTEREQKDIADKMLQFNIEKEDQFLRDQEFKKQQEFEKGLETETRKEGFNARGLADSGLELKQKQLQEEQRKLYKTEPQQRAQELETRVRDFNIAREREDSQRRLQDITTTARRTGLDTQAGFDQGKEASQRALASRLAELQRQQELSIAGIPGQVGEEFGYGLG